MKIQEFNRKFLLNELISRLLAGFFLEDSNEFRDSYSGFFRWPSAAFGSFIRRLFGGDWILSWFTAWPSRSRSRNLILRLWIRVVQLFVVLNSFLRVL